jgi:hypothetical protein
MYATRFLAALSLGTALLCSTAFADNTLKLAIEANGRQAVAFKLHGKTSCVLVDDKVFCAPGAEPKPTRLAASD